MHKIRNFTLSDFRAVSELHKAYNRDDVYLPDITSSLVLDKMIVTDEDNRVIAFACINMLPEVILIHDKSVPMRERRSALLKIYEAVKFIGLSSGFHQLYAFANDPNWERHLNSVGFHKWEKGLLYLNVRS